MNDCKTFPACGLILIDNYPPPPLHSDEDLVGKNKMAAFFHVFLVGAVPRPQLQDQLAWPLFACCIGLREM